MESSDENEQECCYSSQIRLLEGSTDGTVAQRKIYDCYRGDTTFSRFAFMTIPLTVPEEFCKFLAPESRSGYSTDQKIFPLLP
jgi:hypothetical protein